MIISNIRMAIPIEKHNDALRVIRTIAIKSKDEPGCLSYRIYKDMDDDNVIMLQCGWKTEKDLELHVRSEEYRNLLLVLEMSLKKPEVNFHTIAHSMGIETIERIRSTICTG